MARRFETIYRIGRRLNLGDPETWNRRFDDIDRRIHENETKLDNVDAVADRVEGVALDRIDNVITPLVVETINRVQSIPMMFSATSVSTLTLGTGEKTVTIEADQRNTFATVAYVAVYAIDDPAAGMVGKVKSYNPDTGNLVLDVVQTAGSGTLSSWKVTLSTPPDLEHATRTDDPHGARQQAISTVRGTATSNYDTLGKVETKLDTLGTIATKGAGDYAKITGDSFTGNVSTTGTLTSTNHTHVDSPVNGNAHFWLRDEAGKAKALLYWDRASNVAVLRKYDNAATPAVENQVVLAPAETRSTKKLVAPGADLRGGLAQADAFDATGRVRVGVGQIQSWIEMHDTDHGVRYVHNNGGTIGFVGNGGAWSLQAHDNGNFHTPLFGWASDAFARKNADQSIWGHTRFVRDANFNLNDGSAAAEISATGAGSAVLSFHRPGAQAIKIGLNDAGDFEIGGWSWGRHRLIVKGDATVYTAAYGNLHDFFQRRTRLTGYHEQALPATGWGYLPAHVVMIGIHNSAAGDPSHIAGKYLQQLINGTWHNVEHS